MAAEQNHGHENLANNHNPPPSSPRMALDLPTQSHLCNFPEVSSSARSYTSVRTTVTSITRGSSVRFGIPACHNLKSRMIIDPLGNRGCTGGQSLRRASTSSFRITPSLSGISTDTSVSVCVPGQSSVAPFVAVVPTRFTFTQKPNGTRGKSNATSICGG